MSDFEANKRDTFLTETVYEEQINFWPRSNLFDQKSIGKLNNPNEDRDVRRRISWSRGNDSIEFLILDYSAGKSIEPLRDRAMKMFDEFARHFEMFPEDKMYYWEADGYQYLMWLLGLAYLLDLSEYLDTIVGWYENKPELGDDPLMYTLFQHLHCGKGRFNQPEMAFAKAYTPLLQCFESADQHDKAGAQKHLAHYLKHWYKNMKGCYWYDNHKSQHSVHFGYWSFEAGLATLLLGLDDSDYRDMLFYPKDLVDWARQRPVRLQNGVMSNSKASPLSANGESPCPKTGWWICPHLDRKVMYFMQGDIMTGGHTDIGSVIWYYNEDQSPR